MELADFGAEPGPLKLGGKEYRPGKIRPRDIAFLEGYFRDATPDPRIAARAAMEGLPPDVQIFIWRDAKEDAKSWPPRINSPAGQSLLMSDEGFSRLVYCSFRQTIAGFTLDQAREVVELMSIDDVTRFFGMIFPRPTPADPDEGGGPKAAGAGTAGPATSTGTP